MSTSFMASVLSRCSNLRSLEVITSKKRQNQDLEAILRLVPTLTFLNLGAYCHNDDEDDSASPESCLPLTPFQHILKSFKAQNLTMSGLVYLLSYCPSIRAIDVEDLQADSITEKLLESLSSELKIGFGLRKIAINMRLDGSLDYKDKQIQLKSLISVLFKQIKRLHLKFKTADRTIEAAQSILNLFVETCPKLALVCLESMNPRARYTEQPKYIPIPKDIETKTQLEFLLIKSDDHEELYQKYKVD